MNVRYKTFIALIAVILSRFGSMSLAAQENIILGVQTTINSSSQFLEVTDTGQHHRPTDENINPKENVIQEEKVVEEIRSSFEDLSIAEERTKIKEEPHAAPTLQFQHQHANIATEEAVCVCVTWTNRSRVRESNTGTVTVWCVVVSV
ncbi:uncharacterized protein LOC129000530 [Macrosteles quadrilineatus]|uniref:uncharacterized protein LOC129000530 n=1 Tax=Macrosteles quadrilineatus TaxID=74068 RepID=UPI0023E12CAA|nr:uncharacterized protein LOC129000530 [Macrosteles quadrilineatus]